MGRLIFVCVASVILGSVLRADSFILRTHFTQDARLNFTGLAAKYGFDCEEYDVITDDGHILKLFRIPGDISRPVLLMHGIVDTADAFILRGNTSFAVALARQRYDVWAGNFRGTRYSRRHTHLNPNTDPEYWAYSFQEYGYYDLAATIDFVLARTGQTQLSAYGHSEGVTSFLVLGSTRPEYNRKIKILTAFAPVVFLRNIKPPLSYLFELMFILNNFLQRFNIEELLSFTSQIKAVINVLCTQRTFSYEFCYQATTSAVGDNLEQFERGFLPTLIGHFPAGTSRKNVAHFVQMYHSKLFAQYDYGVSENLRVYNSVNPPEYDLSAVTMAIALFMGRNDKIATVEDAMVLKEKLPNVVEFRVMEAPKFNHNDYIWGRDTYKILFPYALELLSRYN